MQSLTLSSDMERAYGRLQKRYPGFPDLSAIQLAAEDSSSPKNAITTKPPEGQLSDEGYIRSLYRTVPGIGTYKVGCLAPETIDEMMMNAQVAFVYAMKTAPLVARFRNRNTWKFRCKDDHIRIKAEYALKRFLFHSIVDMSTTMRYGCAYMEVVWEPKTAEDLGIPKDSGIPATDIIWVPQPVVPVHPNAVIEIMYTKATDTKPREFDGFKMTRSDGKQVTIDRDRALILTHNKRFRNLEGESILEPVYVYWFFYELIWRAAVRYYERLGQPIVVVYYPSRDVYTVDGREVAASDWAMRIAAGITERSAVALPSDTDLRTDARGGNQLWKIEFLQDAKSGSGGFEQALQQLEDLIGRGVVLGDRVATQDGKYGSYALADVHQAATDTDTETRMLEMIMQLERYFFPKFVAYNGGPADVSLTVDVEALDSTDRQLSMALFQMLLQVHPDAENVDFRALCEELNIPILTEEEITERKQAKIDDMVSMQEAMNALAPDPMAGPDGGPPGGGNPPPLSPKAQAMGAAKKKPGDTAKNKAAAKQKPAAKGKPTKLSALEAAAEQQFTTLMDQLSPWGGRLERDETGNRKIVLELEPTRMPEFAEWYAQNGRA